MRILAGITSLAFGALVLASALPAAQEPPRRDSTSGSGQIGAGSGGDLPKTTDVLAVAVAGVAVLISAYALWHQRKLAVDALEQQAKLARDEAGQQRVMGHQVSTQTLIHDQYNLCRDLDKMRVDVPEVSHVLALPGRSEESTWKNYEFFKRQVRTLMAASGLPPDQARAKLFLQEHATALHVANIYEQTILQLRHAKSSKDKDREKVLQDLVTYYETKMLRNPRLRFHWENGVSDMMDQDTIDQFERNVKDTYPLEKSDPSSPLDIGSESEPAFPLFATTTATVDHKIAS